MTRGFYIRDFYFIPTIIYHDGDGMYRTIEIAWLKWYIGIAWTPYQKKDIVLEQIRTEIEQIADEEQKHDEKWAIGLRYAVKIIDKYMKGDKA